MARRAGGSKLSFYTDGNLEAAFKRLMNKAVDQYDEALDKKMIRLNELILSRTPVWEGDTIHNWRWSTRAPDFRHEAPVGVPLDTGYTGRLALGDEPRRRANETRPRQSLRGALRAREPVDIYLTNSSDTAALVEYGLAPTPTLSRSRGALRLSIKEVFG
ncbi:hypothetical protein BAJUN_02700 [Bajunvirus bajun]|uniref:Uncharacterized protein n=1 Tax=Brevundimonas phage vB_BgoS-Bajun TaxID=2948594 RepID=A0A9E7N4S4_9CAUD|nr:hypothetical protein BAJUN_02700 [Brevundimonas phage vB_BgoS-Bajun]